MYLMRCLLLGVCLFSFSCSGNRMESHFEESPPIQRKVGFFCPCKHKLKAASPSQERKIVNSHKLKMQSRQQNAYAKGKSIYCPPPFYGNRSADILSRSFFSHPLIVIDPGHGGKDPGANGFGYQEKNLSLKTGLYLRKILEKRGFSVIMTRDSDVFVPLTQRVVIGNKNLPIAFVCLHYNSAPRSSAYGVEVFRAKDCRGWWCPCSKKLADCILIQLTSYIESGSRKAGTANFFVLKHAQVPAVLIEGGFLSNLKEREKLLTNQHLEKIAYLIAEGISYYYQWLKQEGLLHHFFSADKRVHAPFS